MKSRTPKVKVQHFRAPKGVKGAVPGRYLRGQGFVDGNRVTRRMPEERGGYTEVFAAIGGKVFVSRANCRPDEGFAYRAGRIYAIKHMRDKFRELGLGYMVTRTGQVVRLPNE